MRHQLELHDAAARLQAGVHQTAAVTRMIVVWTRRRRHGTRMRNPQWAIDLREFPRDAHARFVDAVTYGKRNMPPWDDVLDPEEIEALWAYVTEGEPGD